MKQLFVIEDGLANKISYYHILLLMASLPFDRFYSHIILISFAVHTIIHFNRNGAAQVFTWRTLVLQSVFFVTLISTIYTVNRAEAFNEWSKQITIFLMPLIFCFTTLDIKKYREQLLLSFSLVCTATIVYLYADAFLTIRYYHLPISAIISEAFTNHNFSEPIDMHATFFSMQVAVALVCVIAALIRVTSLFYRLVFTICACILLAGLVQLCSKSIFIALFIIINIAIPVTLLKERRQRLKFVLVAFAMSVLIIAGIFLIGAFRERYVTELKTDFTLVPKDVTSDSRLARWEIAVGFIKQSPIIGHGAGSEVGLLRETFFEKKYYNSYLNKLNVHDEYLSFLFKSGIWGLLVYLATLAFGFKMAIQRKDIFFFTFMTLIAIVSVSENLLDVDKGIFFYAFFFSFFMFSANGRSQNESTNTGYNVG
jgi:O-antigen ligase